MVDLCCICFPTSSSFSFPFAFVWRCCCARCVNSEYRNYSRYFIFIAVWFLFAPQFVFRFFFFFWFFGLVSIHSRFFFYCYYSFRIQIEYICHIRTQQRTTKTPRRYTKNRPSVVHRRISLSVRMHTFEGSTVFVDCELTAFRLVFGAFNVYHTPNIVVVCGKGGLSMDIASGTRNGKSPHLRWHLCSIFYAILFLLGGNLFLCRVPHVVVV